MKKLIYLFLSISLIAFNVSATKGQSKGKAKNTTTVIDSTTATKTVTTATTQVIDNSDWDANPVLTISGNFMTVSFTKPSSGKVYSYALMRIMDCASQSTANALYSSYNGFCYYQCSQVRKYDPATGAPAECSPFIPNTYVGFSYSPVGTVFKFRILASFYIPNANGATQQYSKEFTYTSK
ncbi:MAG TPA: hypothetical protein VHL77_07535 [Ferruginibacter sp.]|nr:hypothetical protein [Ferruginibacter sp.]